MHVNVNTESASMPTRCLESLDICARTCDRLSLNYRAQVDSTRAKYKYIYI